MGLQTQYTQLSILWEIHTFSNAVKMIFKMLKIFEEFILNKYASLDATVKVSIAKVDQTKGLTNVDVKLCVFFLLQEQYARQHWMYSQYQHYNVEYVYTVFCITRKKFANFTTYRHISNILIFSFIYEIYIKKSFQTVKI